MSSGAEPSAAPSRGPGATFGVAADPADLAGGLRAEGRFAEAAALLDAAAERAERRGDATRLALARLARAVVAHDQGDLAGASERLRAARATLVAGQWPEAVAVCAFDLAVVHHDLGELDDAVERLLEARAIFESIDRAREAAACNQNLGVVLHAMGRDAEARARLRAARAAYAAAGRVHDVAECDQNLAELSDDGARKALSRT
jgi:tetratricopeptide (TPR) repeat protein